MMRRTVWSNVLVIGLVIGTLTAGPARAATPVSFTLGSAVVAVESGIDPLTLASSDGGATYLPAAVIPAVSVYSTIPGTGWIGGPMAGNAAASVMKYRTTFVIPPGTQPSLKVLVHADNAATVYLNGKKFGAQRQAPLFKNFQNPAEGFSAKSSHFKVGDNTLQINVANYGGPAGLDYLAKVTLAKI
jgi:hypothetical protein